MDGIQKGTRTTKIDLSILSKGRYYFVVLCCGHIDGDDYPMIAFGYAYCSNTQYKAFNLTMYHSYEAFNYSYTFNNEYLLSITTTSSGNVSCAGKIIFM